MKNDGCFSTPGDAPSASLPEKVSSIVNAPVKSRYVSGTQEQTDGENMRRRPVQHSEALLYVPAFNIRAAWNRCAPPGRYMNGAQSQRCPNGSAAYL